MNLANLSLLGSGLCTSHEEREKQVEDCLAKISWVRTGEAEQYPASRYIAAGLIVLRKPSLLQQRSRLEMILSYFRSFPKEKEKFKDSVNCFGQTYEWRIYKTLHKSRLVKPETIMEVDARKKKGFDAEVVISKLTKQTSSDSPEGSLVLLRESFNEFCVSHRGAIIYHSSPAPLSKTPTK